MSRSPINGDVISFCGKGMENLTSIDAGRLRIHIGSKPRMSAKPSAWPAVEEPPAPPPTASKEIVLEITQSLSPPTRQESAPEGLHGWIIALGYVLFGVIMALSNLLTLPRAGWVCSAVCPLPMLCLWAQGFVVAGLERRRPLLGIALAVCAWPLPLMCSQWSLVWAAPLMLALAGLQALVSRHLGGLACLLLTGGSLCLALVPVSGLDPKWGVTLAVFFLVGGSVLASLCGGRVMFRVKYIV